MKQLELLKRYLTARRMQSQICFAMKRINRPSARRARHAASAPPKPLPYVPQEWFDEIVRILPTITDPAKKQEIESSRHFLTKHARELSGHRDNPVVQWILCYMLESLRVLGVAPAGWTPPPEVPCISVTLSIFTDWNPNQTTTP